MRISTSGFRGRWTGRLIACLAAAWASAALAVEPAALRLGTAGHAFDHLGAISDQAEAAAASGATILYVSGCGAEGYLGLPAPAKFQKKKQEVTAYLRSAHRRGIRLAIGYVCATSMVNLKTFDQNWPPDLRARFSSPPSDWRQQDRQGRPLSSWYGGDYNPACMNHPDWRAYERFLVQQQLGMGCDGIFFDNPTVHPQGCYCRWCMERFGKWLSDRGATNVPPAAEVEGLRALAASRADDFLRFRCTIARDFLAEMRAAARATRPTALVTANNSLNSVDALYSQCRSYAYNIQEMSQAEDFVVVEDMANLPRRLDSGKILEYGPTFRLLAAIAHGKPMVGVALAQADYHTPPHLVRLALAEAAANQASHLWWPTWPEAERARMIGTIRPQVAFLRQHAELLNDARPRRDVALFLPFRNWLKTNACAATTLAAALSQANICYTVISEDQFSTPGALDGLPLLLADALADFAPRELAVVEAYAAGGGVVLTGQHADWLPELTSAIKRPSLVVTGATTLRAIVTDQPGRTIVHLLNLDVRRLSSFEDRVTPALEVKLSVRVPGRSVRQVRMWSADPEVTNGKLKFTKVEEDGGTVVDLSVPRVEIASLVVIE